MADEKTCRFCGASLPQDAKYCEECWKSLTSASQLPSQHSERPSTAPRKRTFGWLFQVTLTGKKMLAGGTLLILFLLIIGTMASSYSHSNSASHIDGRAMAPPLKLSPQIEEAGSANIAITPSLTPHQRQLKNPKLQLRHLPLRRASAHSHASTYFMLPKYQCQIHQLHQRQHRHRQYLPTQCRHLLGPPCLRYFQTKCLCCHYHDCPHENRKVTEVRCFYVTSAKTPQYLLPKSTENTTIGQSLTSNAVRCTPLPRSTGSCAPDITPNLFWHSFAIHIVHSNL